MCQPGKHHSQYWYTGIEDEPEFLEKAFEAGTKLARIIDEHRAI